MIFSPVPTKEVKSGTLAWADFHEFQMQIMNQGPNFYHVSQMVGIKLKNDIDYAAMFPWAIIYYFFFSKFEMLLDSIFLGLFLISHHFIREKKKLKMLCML